MQVSPISFGRAIKVNASLPVAKKIAEEANVANYGDFSSNPKRKAMQEFLDKIFNDTQFPNGKAMAVELEDGDVYIFSGKEAAEETELFQSAMDKINANDEFVYWLPDRITRRQQRIKYDTINQSIKETTQAKIKKLVEDGKNGRRNSSLDIDVVEINDDYNKEKSLIVTGITYRTTDGTVDEVRRLDLTK